MTNRPERRRTLRSDEQELQVLLRQSEELQRRSKVLAAQAEKVRAPMVAPAGAESGEGPAGTGQVGPRRAGS